MGPSNVSPDREVFVEPGNHLFGAGSVSPVSHQVTSNGEEADRVDTGLGHSIVGDVADKRGGGARSLDVGPDGVALLSKRKCQKGRADISRNTGHDDLRFVGSLDSISKLLVVPGVDLSLTLHKWRIGVHLKDLLRQRAVGTILGGCRQNHRQIKDLAQGGVSEHLVAVERRVKVPSQAVEANLEIDDQEQLKSVSLRLKF